MAPMILSDDLYGELEDLVLHTPLAKERCRAQAVLWLAEGLPAEQIADTFQVSRQTVYNWAERFRQREGLDLRARLLDAPRSGRPPLISGIIDPLIEAAFAQDPRELGYQSTVWTAELLVHYLGQAHGIAFLRLIRAHWRGWNLVLFEDRASQHQAARAWAQECLKIETRLLPKATPELNAMDHLWRHTKRVTLGSRATLSIEALALAACQYLIDLSPRERLRKAGVLSGNFWLTR